MNNGTKWVIGVLVILLLFIGGALLRKGNALVTVARPITIGVAMPMSGDSGMFGERVRRGVEIAAGAFPKDNVRFVFEDTLGMGSKDALTAYQKLTTVDNVDLLIGPFGPEQVLAIAPSLAVRKNMLDFGVTLCEPRFAQYPQVFCTYPSLPAQVASAMPLVTKLGVKTIGLVTTNGDLGDIFEKALRDNGTKAGYKLVDVERTSPLQSADFRTMLTKVMQSKPDAIFVAHQPKEAHIMLRQLYELGYKGVRLSPLDTTIEELRSYGNALEGIYIVGLVPDTYDSAFTKAHKAAYKADPELYAALGHAIATTIMQALAANNWSLDGLADQVIKTKSSTTAIKDFLFESDHTVVMPLHAVQYTGGQMVEVK